LGEDNFSSSSSSSGDDFFARLRFANETAPRELVWF
jgi:hypothetical protein